MARKKPHEEHENHERWLVSYADFITLLFAFFVVMYSTSSVNEGKMRVLSDSLFATFSGRMKSLSPIQVGKLVRSPYTDDTSPMTSPTQFVIVAPPTAPEEGPGRGPGEDDGVAAAEPGPDPAAAPEADSTSEIDRIFGTGAPPGDASDGAEKGAQDPELADVSDVADAVKKSMSPLMDLAAVALKQKQSWLEIEIDSARLFLSGSARLSREAIPILSELAETLKTFPNPIQVEGFTDNIPIKTLNFPSNWELSAARAASVVHLFTKRGVDPVRMVAIGYGEHRPVASNDTARGRAKNRRVVIVIPADPEIRRLLDQSRTLGVLKGG